MFVRKRKLLAELLESRQLLHGGGFGFALSSAERIAAAFDRLDTNDDGVILVTEEGGEGSDEISGRLWDKISPADGDDEGAGVDLGEWTAQLEADEAERNAARIARSFDRLDTNNDGQILVTEEGGEGSDRLPNRIWRNISEADGEDEGAGVDLEEFTTFVEAQEAEREARLEARREELERIRAEREAARIARTFNRLDTNDDGQIFVGEEEGDDSDRIADRVWQTISEADGEDEGAGVDLEEFTDWLENRENERPEPNDDATDEDDRPDENEEGRRPNIGTLVERLFARLDDDNNGILSEDELGRLARQLAQADTDGEAGLSATELTDYISKLIADRFGGRDDDGDDEGEVDSDDVSEDNDVGGQPVEEAAAVRRRGPARAIAAARASRRR